MPTLNFMASEGAVPQSKSIILLQNKLEWKSSNEEFIQILHINFVKATGGLCIKYEPSPQFLQQL